jgi:polysaccharide transporter, PST family
MALTLDNSEYAAPAAPLETDTLVDSVLILLALNAVQRLVGFVRAILFCRWLNADQLGLWDMAFSFLLLAGPISVLAIPGAFGRYLEHYRQRGQLRTFLRRTALACGGLGLVTCTAVLLLRRWLSDVIFGTEDHANLVALAAGSLAAVVVYNFLVESFTALRKARFASVMQLVNSIAFAALGIVLLFEWRATAESVLISYGGSCLIAAAPAGFVLWRIWHSSPRPERVLPRGVLWARVAPFIAWVLLTNVMVNLFSVVDRYMILHFSRMTPDSALDAVGNYYAARVVPVLLISIASMLTTMIVPHLSHDWEAGRRDLVVARLRLFLKVFGFALLAIATVVLVFGPLLFNLGFRGKFPQGMDILPWTLICCTWFGLSLVSQNYLLCAERARLTSVSLASGLAVNVMLNLLLLPKLGLLGAALSSAGANAVLLWFVCRFNGHLGFRLDSGVRLMLVMPLLLCCGPWWMALGLAAVAVYAVWGDRLLSREEKHLLSRGLADYATRLGLKRWAVNSGGTQRQASSSEEHVKNA